MDAIDALLKVIDQLLGPEGCAWDKKQTLHSCRTYVLEEAAEVVEAIDLKDPKALCEELGDLLFNVFFLSRLAEKEGITDLNSITSCIREKLVRRHPHVFHEVKPLDENEVVSQWQEIKKREKEDLSKPFDPIPKSLPALSRAAAFIKMNQKYDITLQNIPASDPERHLGQSLLKIVEVAISQKIDPELALRKVVAELIDSLNKTL